MREEKWHEEVTNERNNGSGREQMEEKKAKGEKLNSSG